METRLANRDGVTDLSSVLEATKNDSVVEGAGVKARIARFLDENNVSMMGGWT